jgi:hypothetical protein
MEHKKGVAADHDTVHSEPPRHRYQHRFSIDHIVIQNLVTDECIVVDLSPPIDKAVQHCLLTCTSSMGSPPTSSLWTVIKNCIFYIK